MRFSAVIALWAIAAAAVQAQEIPTSIDSELQRLSIQVVDLTPSFQSKAFGPNWAGALSVVGEHIFAINAAGEIVVYNGLSVVNTGARLENGRDAFISYAFEAGYKIWPHNFRFTDILVHSGSVFVAGLRWHEADLCFTLAVSATDQTNLSSQSTWRDVYETEPCLRLDGPVYFTGHESGGKLAVNSDGRLLVSVGHFGFDGIAPKPNLPQDEQADYGKIFAIDLESNLAERLSMGHRNPQGLMVTFDGTIYATEHGPEGGDELNVISQGKNYGWPNVTLGTEYGTYAWPNSSSPGDHSGYELPLYSWLPSIGVSQVIEYNMPGSPWDKDLLVGSMRAESIFRVRIKDGRVLYTEQFDMNDRVRDLEQMPDGRVAALLDTGRLAVLTFSQEPAVSSVQQAQMSEAASRRIEQCAACHSFEKGAQPRAAPNLWGVFGRSVASTDFELYSEDLRRLGGVWDRNQLDTLLRDPSSIVPGSTMSSIQPIENETVRAEVIDYLEALE